jgi:hypothetical protein
MYEVNDDFCTHHDTFRNPIKRVAVMTHGLRSGLVFGSTFDGLIPKC